MGGRVAEEIIFGWDKITTGAGGGQGSDISKATEIARKMITQFGMSQEMGPLSYGDNEQEVFLGRSITRNQTMSEQTARKIDEEVKKLVDQGYKRAKKILTEKIEDLHKLAKALMTYETLTGKEIEDLINKNIHPKNKEDLKAEDEDQGSALGSIGLKPKIVH